MSQSIFPDIVRLLAEGMERRYLTTSWPTFDNTGELDRNEFLTASEASRCARRLAFDKQAGRARRAKYEAGQEPQISNNDGPRGIYARGHILEGAVVEALLASLPDGWELHNASEHQVSYYYSLLSGTPDGFLFHKASGLVYPWEIKSVHPNTNLSGMKEGRPAHTLQLKLNGYLMDRCFYSRPDTAPTGYVSMASLGFLVYVNCHDVNDVRVFNVDLDTPQHAHSVEWLDEVYAKAEKVLTVVDAGEDPNEALGPTGVITGECQYCPFKSQCKYVGPRPTIPTSIAGTFAAMRTAKTVAPTVASEPLDPLEERRKKVRGLFFEYAALKAGLKADEAVLDNLKAEIIQAIADFGTDKVLIACGYRAELVPVKGRKGWDDDKIIAAVGDEVAATLLKFGNPSERLDFKPVPLGSL